VGAGRPILRVTEMSYPVLRGNASIKIERSRKVKAKSEIIDSDITNKELFDELKVVRKYFAMKRGVPDYVIFTDASLMDMCKKLPVTEEEFLNVKGVVKIKMEKYGDMFIDVIKNFTLNKT
jgi:ATP-dependent DNA helicase RecQ